METLSWSLADAKAHLSEVVRRAEKGDPQILTRNGRKTVIIVSAEDWEQKTKPRQTLNQFLAASPLAGSGLKTHRAKNDIKPADLS